MIDDVFDIRNIKQVELYVAIAESGSSSIVRIPIDKKAKEAISQILIETHSRFNSVNEKWTQFELSESYLGPQKLFIDLNTDFNRTIRDIFDSHFTHEDIGALNKSDSFSYYFCKFTDASGKTIICFHTASSMKATLRKNRYFHVIPGEAATIVDGRVFRLADEFEFIASSATIFVLRPAGYEKIADLTRLVAESQKFNIEKIEDSVRFLDLSDLKLTIGDHPRTARVIASLASKQEIQTFNIDLVKKLAEDVKIPLKIKSGKISPKNKKNMHAFLLMLDKRRYAIMLSPGPPEIFEATSRKKVE